MPIECWAIISVSIFINSNLILQSITENTLSIADLNKAIELELAKLPLPLHLAELYDPIRHALELGGKRMRPIICLLSGLMYGAELDEILKPALAIEVFHNFTLLHDDIMDNAPIRRGKPTVFAKWGLNSAILSGDVMMIHSYELLVEMKANKLTDALKLFNTTAIEVCEGQQWDMQFETQVELPSLNDYLDMIRLKTAVLLGAAAKLGVIAGNGSKDDADILYTLLVNLGIAFQIQDDWLDTFGNQDNFGKRIGGDILANKKTCLLIIALQLSNDEDKAKLESLYLSSCTTETQEIDKINQVTQLYKKYKVDKKVNDLKENYLKGFDELEALKVVKPEYLELLKSICISLLIRDK